MQGETSAVAHLPVEGTLPSLRGATEWLNSEALTPQSLRGKVVLVEFWTYTCVNWRRTLPYVRAWAQKYKDHGLVVIGAHTPEFNFEKDLGNVRWAIHAMAIDFPVAIDSAYGVWNAFNNQYWPALYFIDAQGRIRHHHFGEGEYQTSEKVIQQLLREAGYGGFSPETVAVDASGPELGADWATLKSPETYLDYQRTANFVSPGGAAVGHPHLYSVPSALSLNDWALSGDWTVGSEAVVLNKPNGRVVYRFHARDVNLIMGPGTRGAPVRFRVLINGQPPGAAHGVDVDEQGNGTLREQRMYQLIRQSGTIPDRQFEIEFLDAGAQAFDFTFG